MFQISLLRIDQHILDRFLKLLYLFIIFLFIYFHNIIPYISDLTRTRWPKVSRHSYSEISCERTFIFSISIFLFLLLKYCLFIIRKFSWYKWWSGELVSSLAVLFRTLICQHSCIKRTKGVTQSKISRYKLIIDFRWRVRRETSVMFLLCGTGIFLVWFYIYPIVPYAPAFFYVSSYF